MALSDYLGKKTTTTSGLSRFQAPKADTNASQGLYNIAVQSGLQKDADRILRQQKGEEVKKIFSGGFISDIFDVLNSLQYGVVGMVKGKSFSEGVRTRQSFSDKDSLGDNGIPGVIAGIVLDIACDPLTYIAPATILKKIPFATKVGTALKEFAFGKKVTKAIEGTAKTYEAIEGGTKAGKYLANKFVYMFGKDPVYKRIAEQGTKNIAVSTQKIADMTKGVANITPDLAKKILTKDKTGRFIRTPIKTLQGILKPEELQNVSVFYNKIDTLGKEAVDLGLLSKGKYEENFGEYIKNAYTEYEQAKGKGIFGFMKQGIKPIKKRVEGLTPEEMAKLGQIDNPAYLLFKSAFDLTKDVENAKVFKATAKAFGTDVAQKGFKQLPKTQRLITTGGLRAEIMTDIGNINQKLKPAFNALKQTFKADKVVLSEISQVEKTMGKLSGMRAEEFTKFFQAGQKITKAIPERAIIKGAGKLPEHLRIIGDKIKPFKTLDDLMKSDIGIGLEKLYREGVLERAGFKDAIFTKGGVEIKITGLKQFFNFIKKPYKFKPAKVVGVIAEENIPKLIKLQKQIEGLSQKAGKLSEIDKRSIDDAYRFWEDTISKLTGKKEELIEQLGKVRLGDLSGKYVPEHIFDAIQEISNPAKDVWGKALVANFKFSKVILNPATHARNIVSNQILNWWKLGMNPLDPRTLKAQGEAMGEIAKKGGKWMEEAKTAGYGLDTFQSQELATALINKNNLGLGSKAGNAFEKAKSKLGNIYQGEENFAKLSAFIFNRKKGVGIDEAWKMAESATFNYAQVTPFIRKLRTSIWGAPFITFSVKSAPIIAETALKHPGRISIFGKVRTAIENQANLEDTTKERASEPAYIKDGFYIKLPMKDKEGRSAYFDLTYIIPFGDLISGNFFQRRTETKTGLPEPAIIAAASNFPLFNLIKEIGSNQDFYGDKLWKDSDSSEKQVGDLMRHLTKTYMPPMVADQIPGGYKTDGTQRKKGIVGGVTATSENQQRNLMQEMLRNVGLKIQPIDADIQESYQEWNSKKALQALLREKGVMKQFDINYIPK